MLDGSSDLAERLLLVLDEGAVSTTYKYALLAALIDVSLRNTGSDGAPPDRVHIEDLADVVLELYWPHTDAYPRHQRWRAAAIGARPSRDRP